MSLFRDLLIEKKRRPYYCEVEYLESTGTQWLDTGVNISTATDTVEFYFQITESNTYKWIFGEHDDNARFGLGSGDGTNKRNVAYYNNTSKVNDTEMYDSQHYFKADATGVYLNDTKITNYANFISTSSIYLFNLGLSPYTYICKGKIWAYRHKRNGVLIRDMVPVLDWNYVPCMYDKVSGKLFYNQGTGQFSYGREIHYVEYLENTEGNYATAGGGSSSNYGSYINTGIHPSPYGKVKMGMKFNNWENFNSYQALFGSYDSNTKNFGVVVWIDQGAGHTTYFMDGNQQGQKIFNYNYDTYYDFEYDAFAKTFTINGTSYSFIVNGLSATSDLSIYLFTDNSVGSGMTTYDTTYTMKGKIYYFQYYEDDTLVGDFMPAIDENGEGFMFDRVKHTCHLNVGKGSFKYPARQLEYIESSGTQYIDTNYAFTDDFSWEIDFEGITDGCTLFGGRTSSTRTALLYQRNYGGVDKTTCLIADYNGQETPFQLDDLRLGRHVIKMAVTSNKGSVWVDGTQVYNNQSFTGSYISGTTQVLFADNFGSSVSEYTSSKVYALRMWQGTNLVRDYIPCFKDGSVGMYDKKNNVLYTNVGTGSFVAGKVIESRWF